MKKITLKRIATGIATSAMFAANLSPVFALNLQVTENGADSENAVQVTQTGTTFVTQDNNTQISNDIHVDTNTGSNTATDNTAGDVTVRTGDTTAKVTVENVANTNTAVVEGCNTCADDTTVTVTGNGSGSENDAVLTKTNQTVVNQTNVANIENEVKTDLATGKNLAEDNTGGDVVVVTGDAKAEVTTSTLANMNEASVVPHGNGGSVELLVSGNGADTENAIALTLADKTWLKQLNDTSIDNDIHADLETGDNEIGDSTGGETGIGTGDATVKVAIDNMAGFNSANVEDCCFEDIFAKVGMNGVDTENTISAVLTDDLTVFQDNGCGLGIMPTDFEIFGGNRHIQPCFDNSVHADASTGDNRTEDSTGSADGDPMTVTGDSNTTIEVGNQGGSNSYGTESDWELPTGGFDFSFSFDMSDLLSWLQAHV